MATQENENKAESSADDNQKYKYHQTQKESDSTQEDQYGDKPKNHTTPEERMLNPDRGDKKS